VNLILMAKGVFCVYHSVMMGSLNIWVGWQLVHWVGHVIGCPVHIVQAIVKVLIYVGLCRVLVYKILTVVTTFIPCGCFGFWCNDLKVKKSILVGDWEHSMLKDILFPASFCPVIKFFPYNLPPYRVWEVSVLHFDNEDSPLLVGLSIISSNIKSRFDILGQFSLFFVCIQEGDIDGGGFFRYFLFFGSTILGYGCIAKYDVIGSSYEEFQLRNSVRVSLRFLLAYLFSRPSLLH
jgi:hypothetical protein